MRRPDDQAAMRTPAGNLLQRGLSWLRNGAMYAWDIFLDAIANFQSNGDTNQAAAISLYAILSFIPLFILTFLMAGHFLGTHSGVQEQFLEGLRAMNPQLSDLLLNQKGGLEEKGKILGWIGIISLIWFSSAIFSAIETAFNIAFRSSKNPRNYFVSKALAIAMIPAAWAVGVSSILITSVAAIVAAHPLLAESGIPYLHLIQGALFRYFIPYLVTVFFFTLVYKLIPTVRIPWWLAAAASAVFSALMEMAKHVFTWYVANYTRYNVIFGSLETVVILVIWVFYIALILLFCAEMMSSYLRRNLILIEKAFFRNGHGQRGVSDRLLRKFGRYYPQGSHVFREADAGEDMYYILTGRVLLEKTGGHVTKPLIELGPGQYFGEMAALIDAPRTASARCLEDCDLAVIDRETVHNVLRESDGVSLLMLQEFSYRIKRTNEALEETTLWWIRLIIFLYFMKTHPLPAQEHLLADLAALTGKERSEIQDVLDDLVHLGILEMMGTAVTSFKADKAWEALVASGAHPTG